MAAKKKPVKKPAKTFPPELSAFLRAKAAFKIHEHILRKPDATLPEICAEAVDEIRRNILPFPATAGEEKKSAKGGKRKGMTADRIGHNTWDSARGYADRLGLSKEKADALRKALMNYKDDHLDEENKSWKKNEKKTPSDPQFTFRAGAIRHILRQYEK